MNLALNMATYGDYISPRRRGWTSNSWEEWGGNKEKEKHMRDVRIAEKSVDVGVAASSKRRSKR